MTNKKSWSALFSEADNWGIWEKLFSMVSHHSAVRAFIASQRAPHESMQDMFLDLTQDVFLRLQEKNRWNHYREAGYSDQTIDHELNHLEIPNLMSLRLRKRYPESYRIARRVSTVLGTSTEFRYFGNSKARANGRMVSRVYGLRHWTSDTPVKEPTVLAELISSVEPRMRDTRKSGRGSSSHIIISNPALCDLLIDIFNATQSLIDVKTLRFLTLSKVAVEDSRFLPIDAEIATAEAGQPATYSVLLADKRPTPEEALLNTEAATEIDTLADRLIEGLVEAVRNKPKRFNKLVKVVWYCYFDPASRSQSEIASLMGISDSLVCHYRKLFDSYVQRIRLSPEMWVMLNRSLECSFGAILCEIERYGGARLDDDRNGIRYAEPAPILPRAMVAGARM